MDNMVLSRYLNEVHKILFEILCDIDRVCRDNSINYSLDSGTLLGAIREQGFIPWDDDADIIMLREEFEKFIKVYGLQKDSIFTIERDLWVYRIKGKSKKTIDGIDLSKICVDIFVLDNVPENNILYNLKLLLIRILQGMMKEKPKYYKYNFIEKVASFILHYFGKLFSGNVKFSLYERVSKIGNGTDSKYKWAFNYSFSFLNKKISSEVVSNYSEVIFNGKKFLTFSNYDKFLKNIYGDGYMEPPPINQRVPKNIRL